MRLLVGFEVAFSFTGEVKRQALSHASVLLLHVTKAFWSSAALRQR